MVNDSLTGPPAATQVDNAFKRNMMLLVVCQALFITAVSMQFSVAGLVGLKLAADKSLATLPLSAYVVGIALFTLPASLMMKRLGRRGGFLVGALLGLAGSGLNFLALQMSSFWLVAAGTLLVGFFGATAQLYRFAAADTVPERMMGRAISLVLAGGVVAGFTGPQLAKYTRMLFGDVEYLGIYLASASIMLLLMTVLSFLRIPLPADDPLSQGTERPLPAIMAQPTFIVAVLSSMIGYGTMTFLMTATPLSMIGNAFHFDDAATVIQWHIVGMFLPGFFTGSLISRVGEARVILAGVAIELTCIGVGLAGSDFAHYWWTMVLLGVGWNFMFVGGSTLLTHTHTIPERAKTQGIHDFLTFGTMAIASLSSGALLHFLGWRSVLWTALPLLIVVGCAVLVQSTRGRRLAPSG